MVTLTSASDVVLRKALLGESSWNAQHATAEVLPPIVEQRPLLPSITRTGEPALLTAVTNDSEFALALRTVGYTGRDGGQMPALCDPAWDLGRVEEGVL